VRLLFAVLLAAASASAQSWSVQTSGLDSNLRGVSVTRTSSSSPVPIIWACGSHGVILRSVDAGKTWMRLRVPGADALDFRSVQAFGAQTAYVMSIGSGPQSRIYKTADGGKIWTLQYVGRRSAVFLDDLVCISKNTCYALSDPVDGRFLLFRTRDGLHWHPLRRDRMPPALAGEGVFAASGTSLLIQRGEIYFATGGASVARVFRSNDLGQSWAAVATPVASTNSSSGIFSLGGNGESLIIVGGDYKIPAKTINTSAYSSDDGATWRLAATPLGGFRSGIVFLNGTTALAVGPSGEDISSDAGVHWTSVGSLNLNAVAVFDSHRAWGVGPKGTIARYR